MWRCAGGVLTSADWRSLSGGSPEVMLSAAKALAASPQYSQCAADGFTAVVHDSAAPVAYRYFALLGLQGLAVLRGDDAEVQSLLESPEGRELHGDYFYLHDALSTGPDCEGSGKGRRAGAASARPAGAAAAPAWRLAKSPWRHHRCEGSSGRAESAGRLRAGSKHPPGGRDPSGASRTRVGGYSARDGLAAALHMRVDQQQLVYSPGQSLGFERLLLAQLLAARGDDKGVIRTCAALEPRSRLFLLYWFDCDSCARSGGAAL